MKALGYGMLAFALGFYIFYGTKMWDGASQSRRIWMSLIFGLLIALAVFLITF